MKTEALKRLRVEALKRSSVPASAATSTLQRFNPSTLQINNRQRMKKINSRLLKQIVGVLFEELKITEAELGINLVGTNEMAKVNWNFLRHEGPTDVITFNYGQLVGQASSLSCLPQKKKPDRLEARPTNLHGELFICVDEAVSQAKNFKTSWQSEIVRYVAHGVLHLLGHDDLKPGLRRKMKREENRLVRLLARRFSLAQRSGAVKLGA
jgi:probable rRNA maturation factor